MITVTEKTSGVYTEKEDKVKQNLLFLKSSSGIASSRAAVVSQGPGGAAGHTVRPRCPCPTLPPPPTNSDSLLPPTEEA